MTEAKTNNDEQMLMNKEIRERYMNRLDVLNKTKQIFLIPEMECMTIRQVADYFEVDIDTLKKCYTRNENEINNDGVTFKKPTDFKEIFKGTSCPLKDFKQKKGKLIVNLDENTTLEIPNRGIRVFSKRAILRIAMLLRDSTVAREIRTQLLNIVEHTAEENSEIVTKEIDNETSLMLNIGKAYATGDALEVLKATQAYVDYQNRHINKLEAENEKLETDKKILIADIKTLADRSQANLIIRALSHKIHRPYGELWTELYKHLKYKYHIDLKARSRGTKPYIKYIRNDEWSFLQKSLSVIIEENGLNVSDFLKEVEIIK